MNNQKIKKLREDSKRFLQLSYLLAEDYLKMQFTADEIINPLGIRKDEFEVIKDRLISQKLIEKQTLSSNPYYFQLTLDGFEKTEADLSNGDALLTADEFPSHIPQKYRSKKGVSTYISEVREKRNRILFFLYKRKIEGEIAFDSSKVMSDLELSKEELENFLTYFKVKKWLKKISLADIYQLTHQGVEHIENLILANENPSDPTKKAGGRHIDTDQKIEDLRKLRKQSIKNGKVTLGWIIGCQQANIRPETVIKHAPELRKNWYKVDYD